MATPLIPGDHSNEIAGDRIVEAINKVFDQLDGGGEPPDAQAAHSHAAAKRVNREGSGKKTVSRVCALRLRLCTLVLQRVLEKCVRYKCTAVGVTGARVRYTLYRSTWVVPVRLRSWRGSLLPKPPTMTYHSGIFMVL